VRVQGGRSTRNTTRKEDWGERPNKVGRRRQATRVSVSVSSRNAMQGRKRKKEPVASFRPVGSGPTQPARAKTGTVITGPTQVCARWSRGQPSAILGREVDCGGGLC